MHTINYKQEHLGEMPHKLTFFAINSAANGSSNQTLNLNGLFASVSAFQAVNSFPFQTTYTIALQLH
jgi:hypothetical protein